MKTVVVKLSIHLFASAYIAYLVVGVFLDYLGANPVEYITHATGEAALYLLLMCLAITPLRRHFHWNVLQKFRRLLGVWSFIFAGLHLLVYLLFDHYFDVRSIVEDIINRPYIAFGFAAFVVMIPLAVTSFKTMQKRMGKRWLTLHRSVYGVAILVIMHYWFLVKADIILPLSFAALLALLLFSRLYWSYRARKR